MVTDMLCVDLLIFDRIWSGGLVRRTRCRGLKGLIAVSDVMCVMEEAEAKRSERKQYHYGKLKIQASSLTEGPRLEAFTDNESPG